MYAVEFKAKIHDGIIEIPAEHRNRFQEQVRVILLADERSTKAKFSLIDQLLQKPLAVADFKPLSRDEIHER